MSETPDGRPPAFPPELFDRPRPRGMVNAEKRINEVADATAVDLLRDLAATLQQRISSAVGLIDANRVPEARALLHAQVLALDALDLTPVRER